MEEIKTKGQGWEGEWRRGGDTNLYFLIQLLLIFINSQTM